MKTASETAGRHIGLSYDDQVLTTAAFGSTIISDNALRTHICSTWYIGTTWQMWRMVGHAIASVHDLFYAAGVGQDEPLLQDLEFLRAVAETHYDMNRTIDQDAARAVG